jgi:lipopolysaccharide transport system ATP-binding protein
MLNVAVSVENLWKQYRIGQTERYKTLRDSIMDSLHAPFRMLASLTSEKRDSTSLQEDKRLFWALEDVSFSIKYGEAVGIIGRNGAGKSTLLKIISRITEPTRGMIDIYGRVGSLLEVGTGFHPELTGRENIYLNGAILGMRKAETQAKFDEIVAFSEVEKFIDTPVKYYSSGMYMRLAFSVAAHLEPEILLVDEVLAVGDAAFQKKCLGKMGDVAQQGRTVLFVSHNMQAIRQLCQRAILLEAGSIIADGAALEVTEQYLQTVPHADSSADIAGIIAQLPPDPSIRFRNISIEQDGLATNQVVTGKPVQISIEYDVLETTHGLRVYFVLTDAADTILFRSFAHSEENELPTMNPGRYISRATLPADFLAPISYHIIISATVHNVRRCFPEDLIVDLTVQEAGRIKNAYANGPIPFKLAPLIPWTTEPVEEIVPVRRSVTL